MLFYSLVEWQSFDAWTWGPDIANSWRSKSIGPIQCKSEIFIFSLVYDDIQSNWGRIIAILNNASFIGNYSNFYGHNDLGRS